jgi:hypothetical protein
MPDPNDFKKVRRSGCSFGWGSEIMKYRLSIVVLVISGLVGACGTISEPRVVPEEEPLGLS